MTDGPPVDDSLLDDDATVAREPAGSSHAGSSHAGSSHVAGANNLSSVRHVDHGDGLAMDGGSSIVTSPTDYSVIDPPGHEPTSNSGPRTAASERNGHEDNDATVIKAPTSATRPALTAAPESVDGVSKTYLPEDAWQGGDESGSQQNTALFMKPMPRQRGSSVSPKPVTGAAGSASRLWKRLTVEIDPDDSQADGVTTEPVVLEHFRIDRMIGRGGMGAVFLAHDLRLNRTVALKVLSPEHATSRSSIDRFRNEARAAARLDHDSIARVHYVGGRLANGDLSGPALPFIAFEYIEGINIREMIRQRGPLSIEDAVGFGLQLTAAIQHADAAGVVHRDIKPSNVIVTPGRRVKLVDLGLARTDDPDASQDLTVAGTTLGTFDYISPEQAKDPRSVDVRSDIYSLGCTLFHMLAGRPPYPEGTMLQKLLDHQDRVVPDVRKMNRAVSQPLSDLIRRMMDSQPEYRPQTPTELLAELSDVAARMGIRPSTGGGLTLTRTTAGPDLGWRRHLGWLISGSLLGVIALFADQVIAPAPPLNQATPTTIIEGGQKRTTPTDEFRIDNEISLDEVVNDEPAVSDILTASDSPSLSETVDAAIASALPSGSRPLPGDDDVSLTERSPSTGPVTPPSADATSPPVVLGEPFVLRDGVRTETFRTLGDAIATATNGSVIEVRQGGRLNDFELPLRIAGKSLTIQRAQGVTDRPVIPLTSPTETSVTDVRLFHLTDGASLKVFDVDFEVVVPRTMAGKTWSVFALEQGVNVSLDGVVMTTRNINQAPMSIFDVRLRDDVDPTDLLSRAVIELNACLVRGRSGLIRWDGGCPLRSNVTQAAVIASDPLLDVVPTGMTSAPGENTNVRLNVRKTTWIGESPVIRVQADMMDRVAPVQFRSESSVYSLLDVEAPLVAMSGERVRETFEDLLRWTGTNNFFVGRTAWQIDSTDGPADNRSFPVFFSYWGSDSENEQVLEAGVIGERSATTKPLDEFLPADFAPVVTDDNPIPTGGVGSRPAGVDWTNTTFPSPQ